MKPSEPQNGILAQKAKLMKRFLHIALITAMLLPGKGMAFFQHYCEGYLISFNFFHKNNEPYFAFY